VSGSGPTATSAGQVIEDAYGTGTTDEFVQPTVIVDDAGTPVGPIAAGDSVVFFNFRADRVRQFIRALTEDDFDGFTPADRPQVALTTFTNYSSAFGFPIVFPPEPATQYFGEILQT